MEVNKKSKKFLKIFQNRKSGVIFLAVVLLLTVGMCGVMAYFTSTDSKTNNFTVGEVSLQLLEPSWKEPQNIVPRQIIPKDPQIKNNGTNDEYVFLEVVVPYANVETANDDGTKNAAADTDLFTYTINSEWKQVGEDKKDEPTHTITRVYAYENADGLISLKADVTTPALFNDVTFANVVDKQGLEKSKQQVIINGYGIQTEGLYSESGNLTTEEVWTLVKNQNAPVLVDYELTSRNYEMAGITRKGNVVIPETFEYDGVYYKVISIGDSAFMTCFDLTSINIPEEVTRIGDNAFFNCYSLTSINIPDGVTYIGKNAFSDCGKLTNINIPDGVKVISQQAFYGCSSLTSINIPDGVTYINGNAFAGCSITNINIPDKVTYIGENAFRSCLNLISINIPDGVKTIGFCAFADCSKLSIVNYRGTVEQWNTIIKGDDWNKNCPAGMQIICNDGILDKDGNPVS